ncbi:proline-rich protein 2-like [Pseudorca crassidens]|uniref:proline-rich protein 2-like n=1 Tax=Pseudorca crassidens TaxID=82174 RepID=UPI00352DDD7A
MGQNPEQEVRRAVPGLTTPPPTGDPHPSGSNSPPLRCPRPPQRPDLLLQVPDGAERGPSTPEAGVECADLHFPLPGGTTARPSRTPTHSLAPNYPVTRCESPPVRSCAPATRHPAPGGPPPQPIRGAAALEPANLGAREAPRGSCIIRSPPPPPAGSSRPRTPRTCAFSPGPSAPKPSPPPPPSPGTAPED